MSRVTGWWESGDDEEGGDLVTIGGLQVVGKLHAPGVAGVHGDEHTRGLRQRHGAPVVLHAVHLRDGALRLPQSPLEARRPDGGGRVVDGDRAHDRGLSRRAPDVEIIAEEPAGAGGLYARNLGCSEPRLAPARLSSARPRGR